MTSGLTGLVWLSLVAVGQIGLPPVSSDPSRPGSPAAVRYEDPADSVWQPTGTVAPTVLSGDWLPSRVAPDPRGSAHWPQPGCPTVLPLRWPVGVAATPVAPAPLLPPAWNAAPATVVYRPLIPIVPMPPNYQLGRGILGQPTVYIPGQPVRNFLRYLAP